MSFLRRLISLARIPSASQFAGLAVAAFFALAFYDLSYLQFPRRVIAFKGNPEKEATCFQGSFSVERGPAGNTWLLELVFSSGQQGRSLDIALNGTSLGLIAAEGKRARREFSAALLREGNNELEVRASAPWSFRRLRVKNIIGYSSGAFSAVLFQRENSYPQARTTARLRGFWLFLAAVFLASWFLNLVHYRRGRAAERWLRLLGMFRYIIPVLFLGLMLLPAFSKYRVLIGLPGALILFFAFFALAPLLNSGKLLRKVLAYVPSPASVLDSLLAGARRVVRLLRGPEKLIPGVLSALFAFLCLVYPGPEERSGDSLEYVAMLVSWAEFVTPFVTDQSCTRMEKRLGTNPPPGENAFFRDLKERFPALLKNGTEMDLPHFWLYSLAAAVFYWPLRLLSLDIALSFMLLHLGLLLAAYRIIRRKLGPAAGLSFFAMVFFSPLIWFITRVHVEFFTAVLAILGAAFLVAEDFAASGFVFALAATQNPPFAALSALAFLIGSIRLTGKILRHKPGLWIAAGGLILLQPAYYYLRLGVLNPVVATGAARMDADVFSVKKMLCFVLDPDIGLLVNWPVALPLIVVFLVLTAKRKAALSPGVWLFLIVSVPILLWSQSRTLNLNHGGTFHISRYALWFLYVFFLIVWQVGLQVSRVSRPARRIWIGAGLALGIAIGVAYWPTRPETYLEPTRASRLIYERWPGLYDPMPEIFTERYRGKEEHLPEDVWAVSHPSGNKILVRKGRMMRFSRVRDLPAIDTCPSLDRAEVYAEARKRFSAQRKRTFIYINGQGSRLKAVS